MTMRNGNKEDISRGSSRRWRESDTGKPVRLRSSRRNDLSKPKGGALFQKWVTQMEVRAPKFKHDLAMRLEPNFNFPEIDGAVVARCAVG